MEQRRVQSHLHRCGNNVVGTGGARLPLDHGRGKKTTTGVIPSRAVLSSSRLARLRAMTSVEY